jgi:aminoglycoside 6'-N-acetyltransferase I
LTFPARDGLKLITIILFESTAIRARKGDCHVFKRKNMDNEGTCMIIPVSKRHEEAWAELCAALWPETAKEELLRERALGNLPHEYLYLVDGGAIAFMSLSLRRDYVEGTESSPVAYLEGIYVKPEHRGKGIARELVEFAKEWALKNGCSELASDCELENKESELFHKKVGFQEANRIICFTMPLKNK